MTIYIQYHHKYSISGGLGHSLSDYLTPLIISRIYNIPFIHNKLYTTSQIRNMDVNNGTDEYYWNSFLGLDYFKKYTKIPKLPVSKINFNKKYNSIPFIKLKTFFRKIKKKQNIILQITKSNRFYIFDLYNLEIQHIIPQNISRNIVNDLKKAFYIKHGPVTQNNHIIINVYIRYGDLYNRMKNKNLHNFDEDFQYNVFKYIYTILIQDNHYNDKYEFNIISAGNSDQMIYIKQQFSIFNNINYILNQSQDYVFYLIRQSDILIFNYSSFPLYISLYCDGYIIKKKNDTYIYPFLLYQDIKFFDNYLFTNFDNLNDYQNVDDIINKIIT
jgi:hypothetical protein